MVEAPIATLGKDFASLYIQSRFAVVRSLNIHFATEFTWLHLMTIQRIFLHSVILSCFAINAMAETDVSSVITIHEEDASSDVSKNSNNRTPNKSGCQEEFSKKQSETLLLSASTAFEVVSYCHGLNDFIYPHRTLQYIEDAEMKSAMATFSIIREKIFQTNSKINQNKISECAKLQLGEHERILQKFFGNAPVNLKVEFFSIKVRDVERLCKKSYSDLQETEVKLRQRGFLTN